MIHDFKKGDYVKCVDNTGVNSNLTLNKIYYVFDFVAGNSEDLLYLSVINDNNMKLSYVYLRFIKINTLKLKFKKILKEK